MPAGTRDQSSEKPFSSLDAGYLSDGDASFFRTGKNTATSPGSAVLDDGYLSEGGASFYARKIQTRIAIEKQKAAEEQRQKLEQATSNRRPLPGLPEVLGQQQTADMNGGNNSIYRYQTNKARVLQYILIC